MKTEKIITELLEQMTLVEKIGMVHGNGLFQNKGVERLGIPSMKFSDGPMGVRNEFQNDKWIPLGNTDDYVSYLPSNSAIASTWDVDVAYEVGKVLGAEARGRGKDMILAPGINIKRSPLCGRNFEYLSEDPVLTAEMAVALIKGIQQNDVAACVKHFVANNQETNRLHVDTKVNERTLQEIYYPAFRQSVQRADVYSVMGAYNRLNGTYCCENNLLLKEVLRDQWGFEGIVISDWGAVHNTLDAGQAALDIEMSVFDNFDEYCLAEPLKQRILDESVDMACLDAKVRNILRVMFKLKMIGKEAVHRKNGSYNTMAHRQVLKKAAEKSVILLKNDSKLLPLGNTYHKKIAVIGCNADRIHSGGGGSAEIKALYEISPLLGIKMEFGGNAEIVYEPGYYIPEKKELNGENWQASSVDDKEKIQQQIRRMREEKRRLKKEAFYSDLSEIEEEYHRRALKLAEESDIVLFVGGLDHEYDIEGEDRPCMKLPYHQDELITKLLKVRPDTIVTMIGGSPVEMPWEEKAGTILWSYYAGMESGTALAGILTGRINPSGKLAETFPRVYEDTPTGHNGQFGKDNMVCYEEEIMVGYRHYEKNDILPMFCFGHGLSYTEFAYHDLQVKQDNDEKDRVSISFDIENVGQIDGREIVQIYVRDEECTVIRPEKELKAFKSITLKAGSVCRVEITLDSMAFSFYDEKKHDFCVEPGIFEICVGNSTQNILLHQKIKYPNCSKQNV